MKKPKKGEDSMTTITLSSLESRVRKNNQTYKSTVESFQKETSSRNMKKGRVRPKHPTEAKILSMFNGK